MKQSVQLFIAGSIALLAASCNNQQTTTTEKTTDSSISVTAAPKPMPITLTDVPASPEFPGAQLTMTAPTAAKQGTDSAKISFAFNVKNYELKMQTPDAGGKLCNNSDKGQHIHFILDNMPYVALYEPKHEVTLANNTEHYVTCFLSRSYHESIKEQGAGFVAHFRIDEKGNLQMMKTDTNPMLFYSRPKGDYLGKDTANILLDFYLVHATLGNDYKVKADIKNETTGATASFTLNEWKPKFIQGLGTGKCMVTLTLLGKDGQPVAGPNTTMSRNFQLAAQEPMK